MAGEAVTFNLPMSDGGGVERMAGEEEVGAASAMVAAMALVLRLALSAKRERRADWSASANKGDEEQREVRRKGG